MSAHPMESLSALLDGELPAAERRDVEAHLAACPSCARHLHELAAVDALARGLPPAGAPDGYLETLPGRVRRRIRADRPAAARAPWVWPLAAGLALAVLAPLVLQQQRERKAPAEDRTAAVAIEEPAAPPATVAAREAEAPPFAAAQDKVTPAEEGKLARPQARFEAREAAPPRAKARDAFVAPPPAAEAPQRDRAAQAANAVPAAEADTVAPTAGAVAAAPEAIAKAARDERQAESADAPAAGRLDAASSLKKAEAAPPDTLSPGREDRAFRALAALPLSTAGQARHARGAWLRFLADYPRGKWRDEARVRVVEASVAAFRDGADPGDRVRAQRDADAYLSQPDAPQAARVQAALRRLDDPR